MTAQERFSQSERRRLIFLKATAYSFALSDGAMANDRIERHLEHLKAVRAGGVSDESIKELRKALHDRVNVIVAKAAAIADEWQTRPLLPDLLNGFDRLLTSPENDPQCWGKNAISKAVKNFGWAESAIFLRGLAHWQWESTWGGKTDTAGVLRGTCGLALVQCNDITREQILIHLVDAVTEPDAKVRADAARALEEMAGRDAVLLLRLKARAGDQEVRVTGQVLESVLHLEGAGGVEFVAGFLQHANEEVSEEAALALGASRLKEALQALQDEWLKSQGKRNAAILLRAISSSRQDSALEFLLGQIRTARLRIAEDSLRALELHKDSEEIVKRVSQAVAEREELGALFRERFASSLCG
jgi:HEAT repeat protein